MDPARDGSYECEPLQCFACAARDAEQRRASQAKHGDAFGGGAFDGIYFAIREREVTDV